MGVRKKRRSQATSNLKSLKKQVEADPHFQGMKVVEGLTEEKMSAVVLNFIAPYTELATSKAAYEKLVSLALLAWNASLMEGLERQAFIAKARQTILSSAGTGWAKELDQLLTSLIQRKARYFADNKRMIIDFRVSETKDEFRLAIISTP
jgi:hypothetical protein